jgi:hypothetical protein
METRGERRPVGAGDQVPAYGRDGGRLGHRVQFQFDNLVWWAGPLPADVRGGPGV